MQIELLIILIFSVIIHEVTHGHVADALGDPTARLSGRLTLNPIPHIDLFGSILLPILLVFSHSPMLFGWAKPVPYNPYNLSNKKWGEAIVAGAGPLINILLALFFGLLIRLAMAIGFEVQAFYTITSYVVYINLVLGIFNAVPIPPLDGSKVLFALLPFHVRHNQLFVFLEQYGLVLALFFALVLWQYFIPILNSLFILFTGIPA